MMLARTLANETNTFHHRYGRGKILRQRGNMNSRTAAGMDMVLRRVAAVSHAADEVDIAGHGERASIGIVREQAGKAVEVHRAASGEGDVDQADGVCGHCDAGELREICVMDVDFLSGIAARDEIELVAGKS